MRTIIIFGLAVLIWSVGNVIVRAITGFRPKGLLFWLHDLLAYIAGIMVGFLFSGDLI